MNAANQVKTSGTHENTRRQEYIAFIRQQCFEAHGGADVGDTPVSYRAFAIREENAPICLTDILLAVKLIRLQKSPEAPHEVVFYHIDGGARWNLCHDDLSAQSDETITFLYQLMRAQKNVVA